MASIKEYFQRDFLSVFSISEFVGINSIRQPISARQPNENTKNEMICAEFIARLHVDFTANAIYISYFIPACDIAEELICNFVLNTQHALDLRKGVEMGAGLAFEKPLILSEMYFTNLIYVYSEKIFDKATLNYLEAGAKELGLVIKVRDQFYANERTKLDKPLAFISHDSRDKTEIAQPLAERLKKRMCTVWYDEYSLRIGDNLRESIEKGIKECTKCILILSPNFLSNNGWTKKEFDSIFQRELIEGKHLVLPIWHNVSKEEIYNYCPSLANVIAISFSDGLDIIENKIYEVLTAG